MFVVAEYGLLDCDAMVNIPRRLLWMAMHNFFKVSQHLAEFIV